MSSFAPVIVRLNDHLDQSSLGLNGQTSFFALLGGYCASGSIKDVALHYVLTRSLEARTYTPGAPLAEISSGSMARSVALHAARMNVEAIISFPGITQQRLSQICAPFPATALAVHSDAGAVNPLVGYFDAFAKRCQERGYFYVDQTRNPAFCAGYASAAAQAQRALERQWPMCPLGSLVASVGSGATLMGFSRGLRENGCLVSAVAVEPSQRSDAQPPWDDIPGLRNTRAFHWSSFGHHDCHDPARVNVRLEVTSARARECQELLRCSGFHAGPSAGATLAGALDAASSNPDAHSLLIFSDAKLS